MRARSHPTQFSLRSLLIFITVAALCLSWWAFRWKRVAEQGALLKPVLKYDARIDRDAHNQVIGMRLSRLDSPDCDRELVVLGELVHLRRLSLAGFGFTDAALANIESLSELEHLTLLKESPFGEKLTDDGLLSIRNLTSLRTLHYGEADVSDVGLRHMRQLRSLESLMVTCPKASDRGLEALARLDRLRTLALFKSDQIAGTGLEALPCPEILAWLCLSRVTDEGMKTIRRFSNLSNLSIGGPDLTAEGLSQLSGFKRLESLTIRESALNTRALEQAVSGLPIFKELRLAKCPLEEADREPLQRLEQSGVSVTEGAY